MSARPGPRSRARAAAGLSVNVKEALANGRLAARRRAAALSRLAAEHGTTADALALAAVLAQPWADVVFSGAATVETLRSEPRAAERPGVEIAARSPTCARIPTPTGGGARRCPGPEASCGRSSPG